MLVIGEEIAERVVVGVAPGVVGHQPFGVDAVGLEPAPAPGQERGDGRCVLVGEQLDVGQAGVVVDDRVREVVADAGAVGHPVAAALRAIAGDAMSVLRPQA